MTATIAALALYLFATLAAWWGVGRIRTHALDTGLLDQPNARSLHSVPVPRGGGLAIGLVLLIVIAGLTGFQMMMVSAALVLVTGSVIIMSIGWYDDRRGLSSLIKGAVYLLVSIATAAWFTGIAFWPWIVAVGLLIAWSINLYNFMDGSDGLAASQAVIAGLAGGSLLLQAGEWGSGLLLYTLAGAHSGFLIWNWPPARIFMGDVGSCVTGYLFATLAVYSVASGILLPGVWLVLFAVFLTDTGLTLLRRMLRGERWYQAHRQHAYQLLVTAGWSHMQVNLAISLLNLLVILPVVLLMVTRPSLQWPLTAGIYLLTVGLWAGIRLKCAPHEEHKVG